MKPADEINNPAWDYIKELPQDDLYGRIPKFVPQRHTDFTVRPIISHRDRVTATWAWGIPSPEVLDVIVNYLDGRPMVEIGAGNGYWAYLFKQMGVDMTAYDLYPIGHEDSWFEKKPSERRAGLIGEWDPFGDGDTTKEFFPVIKGGPEVLGLSGNRDRVLFMCWPPYDQPMAYDAALAFQGDTIVYIGEGPYGCNADENFWALVTGDEPWRASDEEEVEMPARAWELVETHDMVQWGGLHDNVMIFKRKQQP